MTRQQLNNKLRDARRRVRVRAGGVLVARLTLPSQLRQVADKIGDGWAALEALLTDASRRADATDPVFLRTNMLQGYGSGVAGVARLLAQLGRPFVVERRVDAELRAQRRLPAAAQRLAASRAAPPGRRMHAAAEGVDAALQSAAAHGEAPTSARSARAGRTALAAARDRSELRRVLALERLGTVLEAFALMRAAEASRPTFLTLLRQRRDVYMDELEEAGLLGRRVGDGAAAEEGAGDGAGAGEGAGGAGDGGGVDGGAGAGGDVDGGAADVLSGAAAAAAAAGSAAMDVDDEEEEEEDAGGAGSGAVVAVAADDDGGGSGDGGGGGSGSSSAAAAAAAAAAAGGSGGGSSAGDGRGSEWEASETQVEAGSVPGTQGASQTQVGAAGGGGGGSSTSVAAAAAAAEGDGGDGGDDDGGGSSVAGVAATSVRDD